MRTLVVLASMFLASYSFANPTGQQCPLPSISVQLQPQPLNIQYVPQRTIVSMQSSKIAHSHTQKPMGLYQSQSTLNVQSSLRTQENPRTNQASLCVDNVRLSISYTQTIYIASEIPRNSCTHNVVMNHEYLHAQIQAQSMNNALPAIKNLSLKGGNFTYGAPLATLKENANAYQNWLLEASNVILEAYVRPAQNSIDTPENYRAETLKCGEETQQIIRNF